MPSAMNKATASAIRTSRTIQAKISRPVIVVSSIDRLGLGELPFAAENFGARAIETDGVVPSLGGRYAVGDRAVASSELGGDAAVAALLAGDAVDRVGVERVLFVIALRV